MSAIKAYALELEQSQHNAVSTKDPAIAFRLGMLAAASLVLDARASYTTQFDEAGCAAWRAISEAFSAIDDAYQYLRDV